MDKKKAAQLFHEKAEDTTKRARVIHDAVFNQEQHSEHICHDGEPY